jgi:hypothetical protein
MSLVVFLLRHTDPTTLAGTFARAGVEIRTGEDENPSTEVKEVL